MDADAPPVIRKIHKTGKADPLRGLFEATIKGKRCVVEYEPDADLRDTEQVPLMEAGGIEAFIKREVLPHAADAWFDEDADQDRIRDQLQSVLLQAAATRSLDEIKKDILALEQETEGLLKKSSGARYDRRVSSRIRPIRTPACRGWERCRSIGTCGPLKHVRG